MSSGEYMPDDVAAREEVDRAEREQAEQPPADPPAVEQAG